MLELSKKQCRCDNLLWPVIEKIEEIDTLSQRMKTLKIKEKYWIKNPETGMKNIFDQIVRRLVT